MSNPHLGPVRWRMPARSLYCWWRWQCRPPSRWDRWRVWRADAGHRPPMWATVRSRLRDLASATGCLGLASPRRSTADELARPRRPPGCEEQTGGGGRTVGGGVSSGPLCQSPLHILSNREKLINKLHACYSHDARAVVSTESNRFLRRQTLLFVQK